MDEREIAEILKPLIHEARNHLSLQNRLLDAMDALPQESPSERILKTFIGALTSWFEDHRPNG